MKRLIGETYEKVLAKKYVSVSPIHIQPIFDPDPEVFPKAGVVVKIWVEVGKSCCKLRERKLKIIRAGLRQMLEIQSMTDAELDELLNASDAEFALRFYDKEGK